MPKLSFAPSLVTIAIVFAPASNLLDAQSAKGTERVSIAVNDPRPLASALEALQVQSGWAVTYEEAPWVYSGDVVDETTSVRRDGRSDKRVLGVRGGPFEFESTFVRDEGAAPTALLRALVAAYTSTGYPGVFRVASTGDVFHVIASGRRNADGVFESWRAPLDVAVHLPSAERTALEMTQAVVNEVTRVSGTQVNLGLWPLNLFRQARVSGGATGESARTVLVRVLEATHRKLTWQVRCTPRSAECGLSIVPVDR